MSEVKFRAWAGKQMWTDVAVFNNDAYVWNYEETSLAPLFSDAQVRLYGKPVLMQYTGIKDKNGQEIYEGDIILGKNKKPMVIEYRAKKASFVFAFEGMAVPMMIYKDGSNWFDVIGNIYENLELIA